MTRSEENYLKTIYHLGNFGEQFVNTNAIAEQIETKASSVTDMIKKLSDKRLVDYKKYQGSKLTNIGKKTALSVIRKHRLWEVFLVEKLNFSWDEVHEVAEQLEHIESDKLTNQLDAFLGFPTHDPHGDPIPDRDGKFSKMNKILLSKAEPDKVVECVGVKDSSVEFLQYLDKNGITLGTRICVVSQEPFDKSMTVKINNKQLTISKIVTENIYVKTE